MEAKTLFSVVHIVPTNFFTAPKRVADFSATIFEKTGVRYFAIRGSEKTFNEIGTYLDDIGGHRRTPAQSELTSGRKRK